MNNSINYSGFVDLVKKPVSEKSTSADQKEDGEQGPVMELTVKQGHDIQLPQTEIPCPD